MYILHRDNDSRYLLIDKLKNNTVFLYLRDNETVLPLAKCKLTRLSFIFSLPNEVIDSHAVTLDHHNTELIIRNVIGDKDSKNCKLYKPTCMMYFKFGVLIVDGCYVLKFSTYFNVWKKSTSQSGHNAYNDTITTKSLTTEFTLTPKDFLKVLTHVNIFNKNIADDIIKKSLCD